MKGKVEVNMSNSTNDPINFKTTVPPHRLVRDDNDQKPRNIKKTDDRFSRILDRDDRNDVQATKSNKKSKSDKVSSKDDREGSSDDEVVEDEKEKPFTLGRVQAKKDIGEESANPDNAMTMDTQEGETNIKQLQSGLKEAALNESKPQEAVRESPFALYSHLSGIKETGLGSKETGKTKKEEKSVGSFAVEEEGEAVASMYTGSQRAVLHVNDSVAETPQSKSPDLQKLVTQIVDHIYTIETKGQTDTVVKLQHPPMFQGAELTLRAFENAPKEYNIAFSNLTQEARNLLMQHQHELLQSLAQKDYVVHILTMTTYVESNPSSYSYDSRKGEREGRHNQQQQGQQQKDQQQQK